jgi:hypothetical protein
MGFTAAAGAAAAVVGLASREGQSDGQAIRVDRSIYHPERDAHLGHGAPRRT